MKKIILISLLIIVSIISCSKSNEDNILRDKTTVLTGKNFVYRRSTDCKDLSFCQSYYPLSFDVNKVSLLSLDIKEFKPYFLNGKTITIIMSESWTRTLVANDNFTELSEDSKIYRIE